MTTFFSTFNTGFSEVVKKALIDADSNIKVIELLDGLVIYQTNNDTNWVKNLNFFSNSFLLLNFDKSESVEGYVKKIIKNHLISIPKEKGSFRCIFYDKNQLISINSKLHKNIENKVSLMTSQKLDRSNPTTEYWFIKRDTNLCLFGKRITRHKDYKKTLKKGSLRPDLANLLCLISDPHKDDVFLDPFAGSGSIIEQRKIISSYSKIIAGDIEYEDKNKLDALKMDTIKSGSITKIVTDPPWGSFAKLDDPYLFYLKMLSEFNRVMSKGGIAVILTGDKITFEKVTESTLEIFKLDAKYYVLVNGKKAAVYKLINK